MLVSFTSWVVALSPTSDLIRAIAFSVSLSCGYGAIKESHGLMFAQSYNRAVNVMEQELQIQALELMAESKVAALQQEYSQADLEDIQASLDLLYNLEPTETRGSTTKPIHQEDYSNHGSGFSRFNLPPSSLKQFILELRTEQGWNQTQIIEFLWGVTKGGGASWKLAYNQYKSIMGDE